MTTKTSVTLVLTPFMVPDMVIEYRSPQLAAPAPAAAAVHHLQQPLSPVEWVEPDFAPRTFKLSELPEETLHEMCDAYRREVFKRAGKQLDPC